MSNGEFVRRVWLGLMLLLAVFRLVVIGPIILMAEVHPAYGLLLIPGLASFVTVGVVLVTLGDFHAV